MTNCRRYLFLGRGSRWLCFFLRCRGSRPGFFLGCEQSVYNVSCFLGRGCIEDISCKGGNQVVWLDNEIPDLTSADQVSFVGSYLPSQRLYGMERFGVAKSNPHSHLQSMRRGAWLCLRACWMIL